MHVLVEFSLPANNSEIKQAVVRTLILLFGIHIKVYLFHFKHVYSSPNILESWKIATRRQLIICSINKENHMIILWIRATNHCNVAGFWIFSNCGCTLKGMDGREFKIKSEDRIIQHNMLRNMYKIVLIDSNQQQMKSIPLTSVFGIILNN